MYIQNNLLCLFLYSILFVQGLVDFFGRPLTPSRVNAAGQRSSKGMAGPTHPLWFKFNEGHSNAVRRPIKIKTLL